MKLRSLRQAAALVLCLVMLASFSAALAVDGSTPAGGGELKREWMMDQDFTLADPAPWNLEELKQAVDVQDPRSVAAYWVWAVTRLVDDYNDGTISLIIPCHRVVGKNGRLVGYAGGLEKKAWLLALERKAIKER